MKKKMKFIPFLSTKSSSWQYWPYLCKQPKTLSFRANDNMFKTLNSAYFEVVVDTPDYSCFTTNSSEHSGSFSASSEDSGGGEGSIETVIRGLRSERLFFEPGETSSILEEAKAATGGGGGWLPFKESVVLSMESEDPYEDFKRSMEEMVEAHDELKDWECLEELLCWYLRVNGKNNHGYIVGAFVDLLLGVAFGASSSSSTSTSFVVASPSSPSSFTSSSSSITTTTTPCSCSLQAELEIEEEEEEEEKDNDSSLDV